MPLLTLPGLLKETFDEWNRDKAPRLGAALAYYAVFSIAPLLVIVIAIAGLAFGESAAQQRIVTRIYGIVGDQSAVLIQTMIEASQRPTTGIIATVVGGAALILGALGVFGALQDALNTIWEVQPIPGRMISTIIRDRLVSLGMVLGSGILLFVFLAAGAVIAALGGYVNGLFTASQTFLALLDLLVSFIVVTFLIAMIYKFLPDADIAWRDVWAGAILASILFLLGRLLIGLYIGHSNLNSAYGAAGSLIVILVWIYYSSQILLFGAEFAQVYAKKYGAPRKPAENAQFVTEEARAQEGIPHGIQHETGALWPAALRGMHVAERTNLLPLRESHNSIYTADPDRTDIPPNHAADRAITGPRMISTLAGFLVGVIAGISLSRTTSREHIRRR